MEIPLYGIDLIEIDDYSWVPIETTHTHGEEKDEKFPLCRMMQENIGMKSKTVVRRNVVKGFIIGKNGRSQLSETLWR